MTVCSAKNSGPQRSRVRSQIVALAPFSQNSKGCGFAGLAQAQEVHMCPPALFWTRRVSSTPASGRISAMTLAMPSTEPQPPADG